MNLSLFDNIRSLHDAFFHWLSQYTDTWFEGLAARLIFFSALFQYYLNSAMTKFDGFLPNASAYAQIFPKTSEILEYDLTKMEFFHHIIVFLGSYGELILPVLIIIGLFTRIASVGMIIFIMVQSAVDIWGHFVESGQPFDHISSGVIADQRLLWMFLLMIIVLRGSGALSLDRLLSNWNQPSNSPKWT